jgi:hypothetical protein
MLQINTANRNKEQNATSNAMREFFLQMILFSHWFHTSELTIRIVALWRKLHNELRHFLYFSANNIEINKLRRVRRAVYLAEKGNAYRLLLENSKCGYTLVTLPRIVTPYRDSVDGTRDGVTYQKLVTQ